MDPHVADILRSDPAEECGDAIGENLAANESNTGSQSSLMHKMLARPKSDFQPYRTLAEQFGWINLFPFRVFSPVHARNTEFRQVPIEGGPLAGLQRLSMFSSVKITPGRIRMASA